MKFPPNLKALAQAVGEIRRPGAPPGSGVIVWRSKFEGEIRIPLYGAGLRETARRRRQILAGALRDANGVVGGLEAIALARSAEPTRILIAGGEAPRADKNFFKRLREKLAA